MVKVYTAMEFHAFCMETEVKYGFWHETKKEEFKQRIKFWEGWPPTVQTREEKEHRYKGRVANSKYRGTYSWQQMEKSSRKNGPHPYSENDFRLSTKWPTTAVMSKEKMARSPLFIITVEILTCLRLTHDGKEEGKDRHTSFFYETWIYKILMIKNL